MKLSFVLVLFSMLAVLSNVHSSQLGNSTNPDLIAVVNKADHNVSLIVVETNRPFHSNYSTSYLPHEIAVARSGSEIYVTNYGKNHVRSKSPTNRPGNTLTVFPLISDGHSTEIVLTAEPCGPHGVKPSTDGKLIYVTCELLEKIVVVDAKTRKVSHSIKTNAEESHMIAMSNDGKRAYVANFDGGSVSVIDLKNGKTIKELKTGAGTEGISVSADSRFFFATSVLENKLLKIDASNFNVVQIVDTDQSPIRVQTTPDGLYLVVNNSSSNTVQVFSSDTLQMVKRISVGHQPIGLDVSSDKYVFVANMNDNTVSVIEQDRWQVVRTLTTGNKPDGVVFIPSGSFVTR